MTDSTSKVHAIDFDHDDVERQQWLGASATAATAFTSTNSHPKADARGQENQQSF